ncbi:MAG: hypothetical protein KatS3mg078_1664 [Deltaproteobacteria bacterium]|nr:MAG: hypothetical protein KatS3mg078_1664 [Deltaproteobacteria bacterium]
MDRGIKRCLLIAWFVSLVWGCGGVQAPPIPSSYVDAGRSQEIKELNSRLIAQGLHSAINPADYLIGPGDLLEIKVFESEKLTSVVRVSSRGEITLPLLGSVHVDGMTARETEVKIENLLREGGYIRDPHVSVFVKEHRSKVVSVVGYVKEPGTYELIGRQTLLDVLAAAKGLDDKAGRTVYLTRTEEDGRKQAYIVDIEEMLLNGNMDINLVLKPGDVVYVPEAGTVFVEGAVRKPGSFQIEEGSTTVSQSIAMAGGPSVYADTGNVKLIRYLGNGKREVIELNLGDIQNGRAEDPVVKDRDTIVVGVNNAKRLLYGLRLNMLFGLIGIGYDPPERYSY